MKTALVTGATGFIGSHLCRHLREIGWLVHGVSRSAVDEAAGAHHRVDLADAEATAALCAEVRPDVILHLASLVTGVRDPSVVLPTFRDNTMSTVNLLAGAHRAGVGRVVMAGSMEEPRGAAPHSPYAASKAAAAVYGELFRELYELEVVHLRIHMVYGPGQRDERKLVPSVILSLLAGARPEVSSGSRRVDWVHVDDVVAALLAAATVAPAPLGPIEVGSGVLTSVRQVVEHLVREVAPELPARFGAVADRPLEVEPVADTEAAAEALGGWRARIALAEGLRRTAAAYRSGREHGPPSG